MSNDTMDGRKKEQTLHDRSLFIATYEIGSDVNGISLDALTYIDIA